MNERPCGRRVVGVELLDDPVSLLPVVGRADFPPGETHSKTSMREQGEQRLPDGKAALGRFWKAKRRGIRLSMISQSSSQRQPQNSQSPAMEKTISSVFERGNASATHLVASIRETKSRAKDSRWRLELSQLLRDVDFGPGAPWARKVDSTMLQMLRRNESLVPAPPDQYESPLKQQQPSSPSAPSSTYFVPSHSGHVKRE